MEDRAISVHRERSLNHVSPVGHSRHDINEAGWIPTNRDKSWMCPHCHVRYDHWKFSDLPSRIHRQLSPYCLFILSPNPFAASQMPISSAAEHFNNDYLATSQTQPYNGLAERRDKPMSCVDNRRKTFDRLPEGCSTTFDQLAMAGFHLIKPFNWIRCFYCERLVATRGLQSMEYQLTQSQLHVKQCRYTQQLNDCRALSASSQGNTIEGPRPAPHLMLNGVF